MKDKIKKEPSEKKLRRAGKMRAMRRVFSRMLLLIVLVLVLMVLLFLFMLGLLLDERLMERELIGPQTGTVVLAVAGALLIMTQVVALLWMKRITKPAEQIIEVASRVAEGDFDIRVDTRGFKNEMRDMGNNLNKMIEELGSIELMRSDFVSNVSHEFRAPLSNIQGCVTLLSSPKLSPEQQDEYFENLKESTRQLSSLVDNVLKLSRIQSQNIIAQPVSFSLDEQLRRAVLMFELQWSEKNLELELELPECSYYGSEELLSQVWINLIGNAVKFTPDGGRIGVKIESGGSEYINVTVWDSGEGMSPEVRKHIFEKFYQGDSSRRAMGNGLGLALVKTICDITGSRISVESEQGRGSRFTVSLPL